MAVILACDRCKKQMVKEPLLKQIFMLRRSVREIHKESYEYPTDTYYFCTNDVELCADCARALDKWLNTPPVEENA